MTLPSHADAGAPQRDAGSDAGYADASLLEQIDADAGRSRAPAADSGGRHAHAGAGGSSTASATIESAGSAVLEAGKGGSPAPEPDPKTFAAALSELFIDMPCDPGTPTPLPQGMACSHAPNTQNAERTVTFGGTPDALYSVKLRVRGIFEQTSITGGVQPYPGVPFTVGGHVEKNPDGTDTNAINYQQFQIHVAEPAQSYWLNNYGAASHEIHKEDYEVSIDVAAGSELKISVHDGNDLEIGNYLQLMFSEFPPYDKMASLGQFLRLDIVDVEEHL